MASIPCTSTHRLSCGAQSYSSYIYNELRRRYISYRRVPVTRHWSVVTNLVIRHVPYVLPTLPRFATFCQHVVLEYTYASNLASESRCKADQRQGLAWTASQGGQSSSSQGNEFSFARIVVISDVCLETCLPLCRHAITT